MRLDKRLNENQLRQFYLDAMKYEKDGSKGGIFSGIFLFLISTFFLFFTFKYINNWALMFGIPIMLGGLWIIYSLSKYDKLKEKIEANDFR